MGALIALAVVVVIVAILVGSSLRTIDQAKVGVVTRFGKFRRVLNPGLNIIVPFIEQVSRRVSIQNETEQLEFAAITQDQASVHFVATTIYSPKDHTEETVKQVAFTFVNQQSFLTAMTSAVEASVRSFVGSKQQSEILALRDEIALHAKQTLETQLSSWGYLLVDLTVNDIQFDDQVMESMSKIVSAKNEKIAAENEGQALLIRKTKEAEANGAFIKIAAENEAEAARLRGEGLAKFRQELTKGLASSADELKSKGLNPTLLSLAMYTETIAQAAKDGKGNVIFLNGSPGHLDKMLGELEALTVMGKDRQPELNAAGTNQGNPKA